MSFVLLWLAPLLPEFLARHPAISVGPSLDDRLADLVEERYDVALRVSALPDSGLVARRLAPWRAESCPRYLPRYQVPELVICAVYPPRPIACADR